MTDITLESTLRETNISNKLYNIVYTPKSRYNPNTANYLITKPNYNSTTKKSRYEFTPSNLTSYNIKSSQYMFSPQSVYADAPSGRYNPQSKGRWARENKKLSAQY